MLQQTTVGTVINKFDVFIRVYPTLEVLAQSSEEEVCFHWKGLGYYRRARNLLKAAQYLVQECGGEFPASLVELKKIPGVGEYTACALLAMGRDEPLLCLDTNLQRILSRLYCIEGIKGNELGRNIDRAFKTGTIAQEIRDFGGCAFNEALMDLGREFCLAANPRCTRCPLKNGCKAYLSDALDRFPTLDKKKERKTFKVELLRLVVKEENEVLAYQKGPGEWLEGQWELPTFILSSEDENLKQYPRWNGQELKSKFQFKTTITNYQLINRVVIILKNEFPQLAQLKNEQYRFLSQIETQNVSTATIKTLRKLV